MVTENIMESPHKRYVIALVHKSVVGRLAVALHNSQHLPVAEVSGKLYLEALSVGDDCVGSVTDGLRCGVFVLYRCATWLLLWAIVAVFIIGLLLSATFSASG